MEINLSALNVFLNVSNTGILARKLIWLQEPSARLQHLETNYNVKHFFEFMVCM